MHCVKIKYLCGLEGLVVNDFNVAIKKGDKFRISLGIILMFLSIIEATHITFVGSVLIKENYYLFGALMIGLLLAAFRLKIVSTFVLIYLFLSYSAWKIYLFYYEGEPITYNIYIWIVIFAVALIGGMLFTFGFKSINNHYDECAERISEEYPVDLFTGFNNINGLYEDTKKLMILSRRCGFKLTMLVVKLRYPKEMKAVLKKSQFELVNKRLYALLEGNVHPEDKVYSIGDDGEYAALLALDKTEAEDVRKQLIKKMEGHKWVKDINKRPIRAEVKTGYVEYDDEKYGEDVERFLEAAIEEADYDI